MKSYIKSILFVFALGLTLFCSSCFISENHFSSYYYDNEDTYAIGNQEYTTEITKLELDYVSGKMNLSAQDTSTIQITETLNSSNEDYFLRSKIESNTLYIKFYKSGKLNLNFNLDKEVTITIPKKLYERIEIDLVSCDLTCSANAKEMEIDSVSGNLDMIVENQVQAFEVSTVSGKISLTNTSEIQNLDLETTSGKTTLHVYEPIYTIDHESVSGDLTICLYKEIGFKANLHSVSGDLKTSLTEGSTYLDGTMNINSDTTSGHLTITKE